MDYVVLFFLKEKKMFSEKRFCILIPGTILKYWGNTHTEFDPRRNDNYKWIKTTQKLHFHRGSQIRNGSNHIEEILTNFRGFHHTGKHTRKGRLMVWEWCWLWLSVMVLSQRVRANQVMFKKTGYRFMKNNTFPYFHTSIAAPI